MNGRDDGGTTGRKLDLLYADVVGDVAALITRLEEVQKGVNASAKLIGAADQVPSAKGLQAAAQGTPRASTGAASKSSSQTTKAAATQETTWQKRWSMVGGLVGSAVVIVVSSSAVSAYVAIKMGTPDQAQTAQQVMDSNVARTLEARLASLTPQQREQLLDYLGPSARQALAAAGYN